MEIHKLVERMKLTTASNGVVLFGDRLTVLKDSKIREKILNEAHWSRYSIHFGTVKMFQDLKRNL